MHTRTGYSLTQIIFHWLTAIAVIIAWVTHDAMSEFADAAWRAGTGPTPTLHTIAGMLALILIIVRLIIRHRHGAPAPEGSDFNKMAAIWGHRLLYALVLAVPLLGAITWFGGVRGLSEVHEIAGQLLMLTALGHAAIAIWHQFAKKDGTLMRMIRPE